MLFLVRNSVGTDAALTAAQNHSRLSILRQSRNHGASGPVSEPSARRAIQRAQPADLHARHDRAEQLPECYLPALAARPSRWCPGSSAVTTSQAPVRNGSSACTGSRMPTTSVGISILDQRLFAKKACGQGALPVTAACRRVRNSRVSHMAMHHCVLLPRPPTAIGSAVPAAGRSRSGGGRATTGTTSARTQDG